jgi:pimeloyl-ACP methyl ester carboxylesterase
VILFQEGYSLHKKFGLNNASEKMQNRLLTSLTVFFIGLQAFAQEGYWVGNITSKDKIWKVAIDFEKSLGETKAIVDFIDVNGYKRVFSINKNDSMLHLERGQPGGKAITFDGSIKENVFSGKWSGIGIENARFRLQLAEKPLIIQEEVVFVNKEASLSGTLLLPSRKGKFPVIIFMHGGAAEDRMVYWGAAVKCLQKGIAALIYDKRGVGKSIGGNWQQDGLTALADDAIAAVELLKKRNEIDPKKIAVFGHSEGGWTAPLAASRSKDIAWVIVSGASSVPASGQTIYQHHNIMVNAGFDSATIRRGEELWKQLYAATNSCASDTPKALRLRQIMNDSIESVRKEPWFSFEGLPYPYSTTCPTSGVMELLFQDPLSVWKKIKVPVLAIWGEKDFVVPVEKSKKEIQNTLVAAGNNQGEFIIVPHVNHGFLVENPDTREWDFPRIADEYFEAIVEWLYKQIVKSLHPPPLS